jgi:polyketide cyclase/dehydrase/lipid transport protein
LSSPGEKVWALIGDFATPQAWLPGVSSVEMPGSGVGSVRICQTVLGQFREQLTAIGPTWCSYVILEGPLPVLNYEAVLMVQSNNLDSCRVLWKSAFDPIPPTTSGVSRRQVAQLYDAGLHALQGRFGSIDPSPLFRAGPSDDAPLQTFLTI